MEPNPEQAKEYEEKLKSMSPEELKEFQKKQCIFCHIIEGKVQSRKLYNDGDCTAILDINPSNPGHILLVPNEHYPIMPLIPDELVGKLFKVAKGLSNALLKAMKADSTNIFVANGLAAGQKAQHFMIHVMPRMPNDGIAFNLPQKQMTEQDVQEVQKRIQKRVNELLGIEQTPEPGESLKKTRVVEAEFKEKPGKASEKTKEEDVDLDSIGKLLK